MKIEIQKIPQEGLDLFEAWQGKDYDLDTLDLHFVEPLGIKVHARKDFNDISLKVHVESNISVVCARCLEETAQNFSKDFKFYYSVKENPKVVDPAQQIREEIILSHPLRVLCQDGCKGLCPVCGQNLNISQCQCPKGILQQKII